MTPTSRRLPVAVPRWPCDAVRALLVGETHPCRLAFRPWTTPRASLRSGALLALPLPLRGRRRIVGDQPLSRNASAHGPPAALLLLPPWSSPTPSGTSSCIRWVTVVPRRPTTCAPRMRLEPVLPTGGSCVIAVRRTLVSRMCEGRCPPTSAVIAPLRCSPLRCVRCRAPSPRTPPPHPPPRSRARHRPAPSRQRPPGRAVTGPTAPRDGQPPHWTGADVVSYA